MVQSECTGLREAVKRKEFPKICSFKGHTTPVLCCQPSDSLSTSPSHSPPKTPSTQGRPPSFETNNGNTLHSSGHLTTNPTQESKADKMCKMYEKYVWKTISSPLGGTEQVSFCGIVAKPLIVGGENASAREFPHMARIGYGDESNIEWLCGGSLISERFILSAAHCTEPIPDELASWANLGDLDTSTEDDEADPVTIPIVEWFNHPDYEGYYNDIALYKLERNAPLGIYIRPICLNTDPKLIPYLRGLTQPKSIGSGWGVTKWKGRRSSLLQKVELGLVTNGHCNDSYRGNIGPGKDLPIGILPDSQFCAGGDGIHDTCQADSGGPLQVALQTPFCSYSIIGVTSFGKRCASKVPGVYTNVIHYIKWIEGIVWPE